MKKCMGDDVEKMKLSDSWSANLYINVEQTDLSTNIQKARNYACGNTILQHRS